MNNILKIIGTIVVTVAILGLPVLTCLSFVLEWFSFTRAVLVVFVMVEAIFVSSAIFTFSEVYDGSEDGR